MPEACQPAKSLKRPPAGPPGETERCRQSLPRAHRRTPGGTAGVGRALSVLPTARPIVALATTPAIRGFSCSRLSEYSYHCARTARRPAGDGPRRRARSPGSRGHPGASGTRRSRAGRTHTRASDATSRCSSCVAIPTREPASSSASRQRRTSAARPRVLECDRRRLDVDALAEPHTRPQVAQFRDIRKRPLQVRLQDDPDVLLALRREARGRARACRRRSRVLHVDPHEEPRPRHRGRAPRAATGTARGRA